MCFLAERFLGEPFAASKLSLHYSGATTMTYRPISVSIYFLIAVSWTAAATYNIPQEPIPLTSRKMMYLNKDITTNLVTLARR